MNSEEKLSPMQERIRKEGDKILGAPKEMEVDPGKLGVRNFVDNNNKSFSEIFLEKKIKESKASNNEEAPIEQEKGPSKDDIEEQRAQRHVIINKEPKGGKKKTKKRKSSKKKTKKRKGKRKSGKKK